LRSFSSEKRPLAYLHVAKSIGGTSPLASRGQVSKPAGWSTACKFLHGLRGETVFASLCFISYHTAPGESAGGGGNAKVTHSISVQELAALRRDQAPHVLLDVREAHELEICKLDHALHIPMSQVPARLAELPSEEPIVVMCHHGGRSMRVVQFLLKAGRNNAINLDGGIDAWADEIDASVERY